MADFLFSTRRRPPGQLAGALLRFLGPVAHRTTELHGDWGSLAVAEAAHDDGAVLEDRRGLTVLAGDPLVSMARHGRGPAHRDGRRAALHERLLAAASADWREHMDGQYAALAVGPQGRGRLVTDPFAFIAVFEAAGPEGARLLGTHVDATAVAAGAARDVDPVSAADFVANLTCTFPWTLYRGVRQCAPGSDLPIGDGGQAGRVFWAPAEASGFADVREAATALRDAVVADVRDATAAQGTAGLLLSGGEDSRVVLGAVPPDRDLRCFIYADWPSREVRTARRAARAHGRALVVGYRDPGHYAAGFETTAALVGSHHLFSDVHGWGLHRALGLAELPVVLGGLSCDSLLKAAYGDGPDATTRRPVGVHAALLDEVAERRRAHRERLAALRPRSADEWMSLWPLSMRRHGGNVDGNRRLFRSHETFHAGAVLDVAAAVPAAWKRHRRLFRAALRPLLTRSWYVPHARYRFPWFGAAGNLVLVPGLALARGARAALTGELKAKHGPWPKWRHVLGAPELRRQLAERPPWESGLGALFDRATPPDRAIESWPALHRLLLIQLGWLTGRAADG